MREARAAVDTGWSRRRRRADGHRHAKPCAEARDAGAMRGVVCSGYVAVDSPCACAEARADERPRARCRRSTKEPTSSATRAAHASGRRLRLKRSILRRLASGRGGHVYPHDATRTSSQGSTASSSRTAPDPERRARRSPPGGELLGRVRCSDCLGHQLLGARPASRRRSSRSAPAPTISVLERASGRVLVTAQNHGFCVDAADSPAVTTCPVDGTRRRARVPAAARQSLAVPSEAGLDRRRGGRIRDVVEGLADAA